MAKLQRFMNELDEVAKNFHGYHGEMRQNREFYKSSAVYQAKSGDAKQKNSLKTNLIRVFADKLIHYTSPVPTVKVPTTGATPEQRQSASLREKIIYAVWKESNVKLLAAKWAFDDTVMSASIAETYWNIKKKCARVRRYDPRFTFWQYSNDNERRVVAVWAVYTITKSEAEKRYGVSPNKNLIADFNLNGSRLTDVAGDEKFVMFIRWDDQNRCAAVGDVWIEEPHNHQMGVLPVDICMPHYDGDPAQLGAFYIEPLVPFQAEINESVKRRANIIRRMSNPLVWGRGVIGKQLDDVEAQLKRDGGGFIGLKGTGELGLLQVSETNMISAHIAELMGDMMRQANFGAAAFGENVGANTSGDALAQYFNPTQRFVDYVNISKMAFYESINSKILRCYDKFGGLSTIKLSGYAPGGTVESLTDEKGDTVYSRGRSSFEVEFVPRDVIAGNYTNVCIPAAATPRNELENKRFWLEAANGTNPLVSRTTAMEEIGIMSPEDELELLRTEQSDPALNQGLANIISKNLAGSGAGLAKEGTPLPDGKVA